jgi:uncharacterized membrane protein
MQLVLYFVIYSIIGWVLDSSVRSIKARKFTHNPVLGIPFSPLYGTGALILILFEPWMPTDLAFKFFACGIVLTALELVMGEMSLIVFKKRYWDYTHHLFDFRGHTSLRLFIVWCALGLFLLEVLHPWVQTLF